ncbi:M50 family metallopeptidase [Qipengyuania zhejiangensis]|uniref:M50 family metallopeptidase n=1 Tax=Qipengyuania zhejiangensis TaxID=3077782 RepID=UPI002D77FDE0|nr:M50 family metallopeptidase [Qipengyuania sp. Z2]
MTRLANQDRRQRIALLAGLAIGSIALWQTYWGSIALYPFTILSTWFHEMGHGLVAMAMGGALEYLVIHPDGSGVAYSTRPVALVDIPGALIAAGGPLGPPVAGSGLILASRNRRATRFALYALGSVLLLSTLIWVRSVTGWVVLPALGLAILSIATRAKPPVQTFAAQFLGVQACISAWRQFDYLFSSGGTVGGVSQRSDTSAIAQVLLLPYWFWGAVISLAIAAILYASVSRALR